MEIPQAIKNDFRYKNLVKQVGSNIADTVIIPGILKLLKVMFESGRSPFITQVVRDEKIYYYPTYTEILEKCLTIDKEVLDRIRDVLSTPVNVSVYIDQMNVVMNFSGDKVKIKHPYLTRLTDRSKVIFHVMNHSIRIEIK